MKQKNSLLFLSALFMLCIGFPACSSDDDEEEQETQEVDKELWDQWEQQTEEELRDMALAQVCYAESQSNGTTVYTPRYGVKIDGMLPDAYYVGLEDGQAPRDFFMGTVLNETLKERVVEESGQITLDILDLRLTYQDGGEAPALGTITINHPCVTNFSRIVLLSREAWPANDNISSAFNAGQAWLNKTDNCLYVCVRPYAYGMLGLLITFDGTMEKQVLRKSDDSRLKSDVNITGYKGLQSVYGGQSDPNASARAAWNALRSLKWQQTNTYTTMCNSVNDYIKEKSSDISQKDGSTYDVLIKRKYPKAGTYWVGNMRHDIWTPRTWWDATTWGREYCYRVWYDLITISGEGNIDTENGEVKIQTEHPDSEGSYGRYRGWDRIWGTYDFTGKNYTYIPSKVVEFNNEVKYIESGNWVQVAK